MERLDYSNFGRFCHCAFRGLQDIRSADYLLGKHCINMSYDHMVAFYYRFKDTAQFICDLNSFLYHLKWFDHSPCADITCEVVLDDAMGNGRLLKEECVDELYSLYAAEINELVCELMSSQDDSCCPDPVDDCLPF